MIRRIVLALPLVFAASGSVAQQVNVPSELLQDKLHIEGDHLTFCINVHGLLADFDRALATELANALLLTSSFYDIDPPRFVAPMDYRLPLSFEELYIFLTDNCDAFMGWTLSTVRHPGWMTFTRPYYESPFVLVTTNDSYHSLQDVPPGSIIGTRLLSGADIAFSTYLRSLPQDKQWKRRPYLYDKSLVDALGDGALETAIVWEPTLDAATDGDPEGHGLHIVATAPFDLPTLKFGLVMRERGQFVRTMLDNAIADLIEDGSIEALLKEEGLPGKPGSLE